MDKTGSSNSKTDKNEFNSPKSSNETANQTVATISSALIVDTNPQSSLVKDLNHEKTEVVLNSSEHRQQNQVREKRQKFNAAKRPFYLYVQRSVRWERLVKQSEY